MNESGKISAGFQPLLLDAPALKVFRPSVHFRYSDAANEIRKED
jgi:hypothetical protein